MTANLQRASAPSADAYIATWESLRKRYRAASLALLAYVPTLIVWVYFGRNPVVAIALVPVVVVIMLTMRRLYRFPCPRCRELFFSNRRLGLGIFVPKRCIHCGLAMGTPTG